MSEYQYYEFAAIDRPLTRAEMAQLRAVSTRAEITPSGFVNHYEWGDLKAKPLDWMRRYFDAFVYTANWCSCRLALRLPLATFSREELRPFECGPALTISATDSHWIFDWSLDESEDYERFEREDGSGWMRRLAPLRDELLRGDLRPLYLGWLAGAADRAGDAMAPEMDDDSNSDTLEPPPPPGLSDLTPPQQALVEFLALDTDWLAATRKADATACRPDEAAQAAQMTAWLAEWSPGEMAAVIRLMAQGEGPQAERQVKARHAAWLKARRAPLDSSGPRRDIGQLRELAQAAAGVRQAREAQERAAQQAEQRRQHEIHLRRLMADASRRWAAIDALAQRGIASGYEQAVSGLQELAQGYALTASRQAFDQALCRWLVPHARRTALLRRLADAGIYPPAG